MSTKRYNRIGLWLGLSALLALANRAAAQPVMPGFLPMILGPGGNAVGRVNLPYVFNDGNGPWYIFVDGALRQQMGQPVFQQGAMLTIDGNSFQNATGNQATLDPKTRELVLQGINVNGITATRRILFDRENHYVRYVDLIHNDGPRDRTVNIGFQTTLFWGVQQSRLINAPNHADQALAWTATTAVGRTVLEIYGGPGGKTLPTINYQVGSNMVQANLSLNVPAGKDAAIMHFHMFTPNPDAAANFVSNFNPAKISRTLSPGAAQAIVNFDLGEQWVTSLDILRGDLFDIVELHSGDRIMGTWQTDHARVESSYGTFDLPPQRVIAMINSPAPANRQLLVADDGEVYGGKLDEQTIDMQLTSGQNISIPLAQVSRVGRRRRGLEAEDWDFEKPMVLLRGGDRIQVQPGPEKIAVQTRYGLLALDPAAMASIVFQSEENQGNEIDLLDGSKFAGTLSASSVSMQLDGVVSGQTVQFPVSQLLRIQYVPRPPDADADAPSVQMLDGDQLVGALEGNLKLKTAFADVDLDAAQIRKMVFANNNPTQVTLWDGSTMSGQIADSSANCKLLSGLTLSVPIAMIHEYNQPYPHPSAEMTQQITAAAADLSADDWRQRDQAQESLESMGPVVIGVLRDIRPQQSPEGQQRIDSIIKKVESTAAANEQQPQQ